MKKFFGLLAAVASIFTACAPKTAQADAVSEAGSPDTTTVQHPDWSRNAVIYEVNTRQYTPEGTFAAFGEHIDRLKELGVDILWFMPIHPISELNRKGELGSYYAVRDYKAVNPEFGTLDDFRKVVDKAHEAGMKVIIDWVPNHTGCDNAWVEEHPEYYKLNEEGKMYGPFDWSDVYQLDYSNEGTREAMTESMAFWLREAGIDGFRCDVAGMVPVDFWNEARPALEKAAGKPIFMLAEATEPELLEHAFDMDYNWPMKDLFNQIAMTSGQRPYAGGDDWAPRHAADIDSLLRSQAAVYPADSYMMNMITNHDLNSWEGTEFERLGELNKAFAVLTYTLPGMPLIYTGQETGMNRAFEFFKKDKAPEWSPRNEYFGFYQTLNSLKHSRKELAAGVAGAPVEMLGTGSADVLSFVRGGAEGRTFVAVNLGAETAPLALADAVKAPLAGGTDIFSGNKVDALPDSLASGAYMVLTY
ncbi:MAG: alpha-amylase [Muribaculaceae bacterium]|nr:alpha-amylase [Muribaculaceae bacterium]